MKNKYLNKYLISVVVFLVDPKEQMLMIIVLQELFLGGTNFVFYQFKQITNWLKVISIFTCVSECVNMSSGEEKFISTLKSKFELGKTRNIYPRDNYNNLLSKIKSLKLAEKKSTGDYYNLNRYDIFIVGGFERLITKVKEHDESNFKIYVFLEELYGILGRVYTQ